MGVTFPEDFRASLLVHDGQESDSEVSFCPATCPLASLERIVEQYQEVQQLVEPVEGDPPLDLEDHFINILYYSNRIPIAGTQWFDGDNSYLDLAPGPRGTSGQLVTTTSECDFVVLDRSFEKFFERYVKLLESGALVWRDGAVAPKDADFEGHPADDLALINYEGIRNV